MVKRIRIRKGDLFEVKLESDAVVYFQYLLLDPCQLNSEVIRVFNYRGLTDESFDYNMVFSSGVNFYAHVIIQFGLKMDLWRRIGNYQLEYNFKPPLFRDTFGQDEEYDGNRIMYKKSNSWNIWQAGDDFESRRVIGYINNEFRTVDIGLVYPPREIIHRIETGEYSDPYLSLIHI